MVCYQITGILKQDWKRIENPNGWMSVRVSVFRFWAHYARFCFAFTTTRSVNAFEVRLGLMSSVNTVVKINVFHLLLFRNIRFTQPSQRVNLLEIVAHIRFIFFLFQVKQYDSSHWPDNHMTHLLFTKFTNLPTNLSTNLPFKKYVFPSDHLLHYCSHIVLRKIKFKK